MSTPQEENVVTKIISSEIFKIIITLTVFASSTSWFFSNTIATLEKNINTSITELRLENKDIKYTNELSNKLTQERLNLLEKKHNQEFLYLEKRLNELRNVKK